MGKISQLYLTSYPPVIDKKTGKNRYQEILRINVMGTKELNSESSKIYKALIQEGIFTEAGRTYLWGNKIEGIKLIFRKIYSPVHKISYRDRQELKMSADVFEKFLIDPQFYVREGTAFLKGISGGGVRKQAPGQTELDDFFKVEDTDGVDDE